MAWLITSQATSRPRIPKGNRGLCVFRGFTDRPPTGLVLTHRPQKNVGPMCHCPGDEFVSYSASLLAKPSVPAPTDPPAPLAAAAAPYDEVTRMSTSAIQVLLPESPWLGFVPPCTASDPELFFAESPVDLELAKTVCAECPIRKECLEGALDRHEPYGVWGGELIIAGAIVARKRPRGRPRKSEKECAA
jgi:WhiB family transcriptional regulator, redox-sensing transcriptional regulator